MSPLMAAEEIARPATPSEVPRTAAEERADVVEWLWAVRDRIGGHLKKGMPEVSPQHTEGMVAGCCSAAMAIEQGAHIGASHPRTPPVGEGAAAGVKPGEGGR